MKKKLKKEEKSVSSIAMSEVTGTPYFDTSKEDKEDTLSTLELSFGNEDMNKLVGKLNEVINKLNGN